MRKLLSNRGETLIESLVSILIVALIMLFLSNSIVAAAKINRQLRDTDIAFSYEDTPTREEMTMTVSGAGGNTVGYFTATVPGLTTENGYQYYRYEGGQTP